MYRFRELELEPALYRLTRRGEPVKLEPQVFDVLLYLVRHRDRVVTKQELIDGLWEQRFVGESALTRTIYEARRALGASLVAWWRASSTPVGQGPPVRLALLPVAVDSAASEDQRLQAVSLTDLLYQRLRSLEGLVVRSPDFSAETSWSAALRCSRSRRRPRM